MLATAESEEAVVLIPVAMDAVAEELVQVVAAVISRMVAAVAPATLVDWAVAEEVATAALVASPVQVHRTIFLSQN